MEWDWDVVPSSNLVASVERCCLTVAIWLQAFTPVMVVAMLFFTGVETPSKRVSMSVRVPRPSRAPTSSSRLFVCRMAVAT